MATFITRLGGGGGGTRLAVKDLIDMAGLPTTAACRAVADEAAPAGADASCLSGSRRAEREGDLRFVGKTNLHELAIGASGINPAFGTPVNPLDARLVPGGSSSGSAVAVGAGEADVAFGTDTGGSVRVPSACCGTSGLKTTHGRVPLTGVWPLSERLDTVGPMARDVAGVTAGMALLEPGFAPWPGRVTTVGRFRPQDIDPEVDRAVDRALALAELDVLEVELPGWNDAMANTGVVIVADAWRHLGRLLDGRDGVGAGTAARIELGRHVGGEAERAALEGRRRWVRELEEVFSRVDAIALPTLPVFPPTLDLVDDDVLARLTAPVNLAGIPALALPVPAGPIPASLQLLGPRGSEERLVSLATNVEEAVSG